jgi:hypothetical protein
MKIEEMSHENAGLLKLECSSENILTHNVVVPTYCIQSLLFMDRINRQVSLFYLFFRLIPNTKYRMHSKKLT